MNNQTAILRVTRDIIYFTITPSTQPITFAGAGGGGITVNASFTTTPNIAAEGFMMAVLPQINETDGVVLNVRPTIRRQVGSARDRSEEHTSELQSPCNLVCRLLLEKK